MKILNDFISLMRASNAMQPTILKKNYTQLPKIYLNDTHTCFSMKLTLTFLGLSSNRLTHPSPLTPLISR